MMHDSDIAESLQNAVAEAAARAQPVQIVGGGSKVFYGREPEGVPLSVGGHRGVVSYEPTELVLTARSGTPLADIESVLAERGQALAFEPPHFGPSATLGGTIACGLSGPRRPYVGAARDFVLGMRIINGSGAALKFGGQVMKNVAGYDVSRLMVGALGTLGVLTEVSLRVAPRPRLERTLAWEMSVGDAIAKMNEWAGQPLPLSAAAHADGVLRVRLSGSPSGVEAAGRRLGGDQPDDGEDFWRRLREHDLPFFALPGTLWRISLPAAQPPLDLQGTWLTDWGGAQRWLKTELPALPVRREAAARGGHATQFRGGERTAAVFHELPAPLMTLHRNVKRAFDPKGILNPGRLYGEL